MRRHKETDTDRQTDRTQTDRDKHKLDGSNNTF